MCILRLLTSILILLTWFLNLNGQVESNKVALLQIIKEQQIESPIRKKVIDNYLEKHQLPAKIVSNESLLEILYIDNSGRPQYLITSNSISAETISTNDVYLGGDCGLELDGEGIEIHQWDAGSVRNTHQEFDTRVTNGDSTAISWHSTHVAGTIVASGVESNARGMAFSSNLKSFDWNEFNEEMATEALAGAILSNHSYGWLRGWEGNTWWGDPEISDQEDYRFGFYDETAELWDDIVYNAPYFLIVKSAGNDRNECGDNTYPCDGPYDCIDQLGIAKNNLVVAAVNDIPGGYTQASDVVMSGFSSWGPADDGRIKPDISANGVGLFSTNSGSDNDYRSASGTSMSTPSVCGSIGLIQQHYENLNGENNFMKASTVKALVIHTADQTGDDTGPDYKFGWGLMNTKNAILKISQNDTLEVIFEETLENQETFNIGFTSADTGFIKATLVWTDPPGIPLNPSLDPSDIILVNDLDLSIKNLLTSAVYYPWKLDRDNPTNPATNTSKNIVDNVENVYIPVADSGTGYLLTVNHCCTLENGYQDFSLICTFTALSEPVFESPEVDFIANNTSPIIFDSVEFADLSSNMPNAWSWTVIPNYVTFINGTDSASQNPVIRFDSLGVYDVSLTSTNEVGSGNETKLDYITTYYELTAIASALPDTICAGNISELTLSVNGGNGNYEYWWTSDPPGFTSSVSNPIVTPEETTYYFVEVYDGIQTAFDTLSVIVNNLPVITLENWPEVLCNEDEPPVQLEASPQGGVFSGNNITPDGIFTPEEASIGWNIITYTYQDNNDCVNVAADSIFIDDCVSINFNNASDKQVNIYPNPNNGNFIIDCDEEIKYIEIIDQLGNIIKTINSEKKPLKIELVEKKGIFIIRIILVSGINLKIVHKKVVVQ